MLSQLSVRSKLLVGFGSVVSVFIISTLLIFQELNSKSQVQELLLNVRTPTVYTGLSLSGAINQSLSGLRGYLILGADPKKAQVFKGEREDAWRQIDQAMDEMQQYARHWTVPQNRVLLKEMTTLVAEFRQAQQQIEDIAHTRDNIPSVSILFEHAAPLASRLVASLTGIIDEELQQPVSAERKRFLKTLADSRASFALGLANIRAYLLSGDVKFKNQFLSLWDKNQTQFSQLEAMGSLLSTEQREHWRVYRSRRTEFRNYVGEMLTSRAADDWNKANYWLGTKAAPRAARIQSILDKMRQSQKALFDTEQNNLNRATESLKSTLLLVVIISLAVAVAASVVIARAVLRPLGGEPDDMAALADKIAHGDLSSQFPQEGKATGLNLSMINMNRQLKSLVASIGSASGVLSETAQETSVISSQTNHNVQQQYEQTEYVASAIEEMTATIGDIAKNAAACADVTVSAQSVTDKGEKQVHNSIHTIGKLRDEIDGATHVITELQQKSTAINSVSEVISNIAEQTNLLALNAAIEAARAGEQGRGFAVVADEVRSLASKTQESIASISEIIGSLQQGSDEAVLVMQRSQKEAESTIQQAEKSGEALREISGAVENIGGMAQQIAVASEEQSTVIADISRNVQEISDLAQMTSQGGPAAVQASERLAQQASELKGLIASFRVDSNP